MADVTQPVGQSVCLRGGKDGMDRRGNGVYISTGVLVLIILIILLIWLL